MLHVGSPTKALTQSSRHNVSLDARRLFAPTAFPKKANCEEFAFRSTGEALQKQANRFTKARKEEIHRSHTTSGKQQRKTQKDPALGIPGVGSLLFIREKPSPLFSISQWLPCSASRDVQHLTRTRSVFRAYGGHKVPLSPTAFPTKANGKEFAFCSIGEALQKQGKNLHKGNHRNPTTCKK
mgnify:CR=1 FL=1